MESNYWESLECKILRPDLGRRPRDSDVTRVLSSPFGAVNFHSTILSINLRLVEREKHVKNLVCRRLTPFGKVPAIITSRIVMTATPGDKELCQGQ